MPVNSPTDDTENSPFAATLLKLKYCCGDADPFTKTVVTVHAVAGAAIRTIETLTLYRRFATAVNDAVGPTSASEPLTPLEVAVPVADDATRPHGMFHGSRHWFADERVSRPSLASLLLM